MSVLWRRGWVWCGGVVWGGGVVFGSFSLPSAGRERVRSDLARSRSDAGGINGAALGARSHQLASRHSGPRQPRDIICKHTCTQSWIHPRFPRSRSRDPDMKKPGYEPLATSPEQLEDGTAAHAAQCKCCVGARCRPLARLVCCIALGALRFSCVPMMLGPPPPHHGPHAFGPHGGGPAAFADEREAAMSIATFELEAAVGPAIRDPRRLFSIIKGELHAGMQNTVPE